jgi:alpha-galactosidase
MHFKHFTTLMVVPFITYTAKAQHINIPVETAHNAMVLQVNKQKDLSTIYFGQKLANAAEYEQVPAVYKQAHDYTGILNAAYTPSGSRSLLEPAITVTHADGNNSLDLRYVSHTVTKVDDNVSLLTVVLKDPVYDYV